MRRGYAPGGAVRRCFTCNSRSELILGVCTAIAEHHDGRLEIIFWTVPLSDGEAEEGLTTPLPIDLPVFAEAAE